MSSAFLEVLSSCQFLSLQVDIAVKCQTSRWRRHMQGKQLVLKNNLHSRQATAWGDVLEDGSESLSHDSGNVWVSCMLDEI